MMPEEWPIAAPAAEHNAPARAAGRGRLATVRADFFLNPDERLTEQERALMTAMLHCLVGDIADELRAALPNGWSAANDSDNAGVVHRLTKSRLLDDPALMRLLLRRADEERIGTAARARGGRREARALQGLVSHADGEASAAAMALILARGKRRDRFGQCLIAFDDLPFASADGLVHAVAAALRTELPGSHALATADGELAAAAAQVLEQHDESRSLDALTADLVRLLDERGGLTDDLILAAAHEGEVPFVAHVLAGRAGLDPHLTLDELLSGLSDRVMALFKMASFSRPLSAGLLAGVGDLMGIGDPGEAIGRFDRMTKAEAAAARTWLATAPAYRKALEALGGDRGQRSL